MPAGGLTLVLALRLHEVQPGTDVLGVWSLCDELQVQRVTARGDAIGARIVRAVNAALSSAICVSAAVGSVPLVAIVAVGGAVELVKPPPVGVDGDCAGYRCATPPSGALRPCHGRVCLGGQRACLLGAGSSHEGSEGSKLGVHLRGRTLLNL